MNTPAFIMNTLGCIAFLASHVLDDPSLSYVALYCMLQSIYLKD